MRRFVLVSCALLILVPAAVHAQNTRSAVSVAGNDAAACTVQDPCRTFAGALAKTAAGGEIFALSSGGYGPFTIDKSVSIISPAGIHAAITAAAGDAITINAPSSQVSIRNLYLSGRGAATGIHFVSGDKLALRSIVAERFATGILLAAPGSYSDVDDCVVRFASGSTNPLAGIAVESPVTLLSGQIIATIDRSRFDGNYTQFVTTGVYAGNNAKVTVTNTTSAYSNAGFEAAFDGQMSLENCVASFGQYGVWAHSDGVQHEGGFTAFAGVVVSNSAITHNGIGFIQIGGAGLFTRGNNTLWGNATDVSGTVTTRNGQ